MPYSTYQLGEMVANAASAAGINPRVAVEQIRAESSFNPNAVSSAGAQGLAQFMPGTWAQYGQGSPFDPAAAVAAYVRYMRHLLGVFNGRIDIALAAYNSGENRQEYRNAAAQGRPINWGVLPAGVQSQTQNYVNKILSAAGGGASSDNTLLYAGAMSAGGALGLVLLALAVVMVIRR